MSWYGKPYSPTPSCNLIWDKGSLKFHEKNFGLKLFDCSILYPKERNIYDIAKVYFIILLISVDHPCFSWVLFYEILNTLSINLKINYLAKVPSLHCLPFIIRRKRTSPKWSIRGGIQKEEAALSGKSEYFVSRKI